MSEAATTAADGLDVATYVPSWGGSEIESHPVVRGDIKLPTPSIRMVFDVIANTALQRAPGCCFHAKGRFGKTSAIEVLTAQLAQSFPDMPVFSMAAAWHVRFSETVYFGELLHGCSHSLALSGKAEPRRARLHQFLWAEAKARGSDRIMLFVDEAQNWHEQELTTLRDVSNHMALHHGIKLIVVSFGTPEIVAQRASLIHMGRIDLIGRFMAQQYEFKGISTLEELILIMSFYDNAAISEYPEGSARSYSEYLLGQAYAGGWRLSKEGPRLWEQFKLAAQASGGLGQVGMLWVAESIRRFFLDHLEYDHPGLSGDASSWMLAVKHSGFKDSLSASH